MRAFKVSVALAGFLALLRFGSIYYGSWEFDDFVRQQTKRIHSKAQFKQAILDEARAYSLPISESDIVLNRNSSVMRVTVDYTVPVDLIVYQPKLQFHVISAGIVYE
jgi:hypothetical protein